ncbi:MAG: hypothetical protein LIO59_05745, partial [Oscillospiraceae bacterium]|nr:hypothetical protein [Oscillospiraceae bacterium]
MEVSKEIICRDIGRMALNMLAESESEIIKTSETRATEILEEIKAVLYKHKELSDFEIVDRIVDIFIDNGMDIGGCHDF